MKPLEYNVFQLSSGRKFYAYDHMVGLRPAFGEYAATITYGYEGVCSPNNDELDSGFTVDERIEIADYAIAEWQAYKKSLE